VVTRFAHARGMRDSRGYQFGLNYGREWDEDHAIGEVGGQVGSHLQGQPRLADASGARQRQEPDVAPTQKRRN